VTRAAGFALLGILIAIAAFLMWKGLPALGKDDGNFFTTKQWAPDSQHVFGIAALAYGTVVSSVIALVLGVPVAIGVALFITEYAPRRVSRLLGYITDMLAAVPSVIYGLWGFVFLAPHVVPLQKFLNSAFGWIPIFAGNKSQLSVATGSLFVVGLVLAIMILPIVAAISREVFRQADPAHKEAALALGATKLEAIRYAVLPPSRPGLVGASMLGLGRALGETIAVALVIGTAYRINPHILEGGAHTIAANIATNFGESGPVGRPALILSGLVLFAITLAVNLAARAVIARSGRTERTAL